MRVELAEVRAQNAELRLTCQLLGERTEALVERDQRHGAENAALRECNRLLSEEVAELRRRVDQNPRNSHRPASSEGYAKPAPRSRRERTDALTLYTVSALSAQRGIEAMTEGGVLPALSRDAVLGHDFWAPYWHFDVTHAVCGAHLGRELVAAAEVEGQADWASGLDRLLIEINRTVASARDTGADELATVRLISMSSRS